ncbi:MULTISPECIES: 50S ribosomal protein L25/general stress protein Ctc [Arthrospira]|jgi:large subunit ribosomal protein L25|uniref:Large ribosomal subunit protein bL25 n=1 Tax=Limnospira platensis NIES-46 TaxID=1236695 RepID=A0A5M3TBL1_LIMPL|nr:50S ribosomal protein L25/general stress protein Ctc [Arthrospira platensis]AMW31358.1 50S ribosomal protein L25 [Arthrospira platensis YZ]KDR57024.1 50S ribosomal protein L25 [Arthrospira platensis str. Paraca]MBD2668949.1 50S ribosomal protein L25/general stress protein Ctc [Arthrospira platensis FACHB-439]MBD2709385.1 50S ribosomal protein L25/general stress protein Ctc [Arthrospira platensis FACHB-835]MDF2208836.1 50S ribosomal protein L25/general stress protein Ctc [Arthrospira platens
MEITVKCQKRPSGSKPRALRREGLIPAVLYGHKGAESEELTIDAKTAENLMKKGAVNHTLIQLNIPDLSWAGKALLREVQTHPWKGFPYHLSFFSIGTLESVEVTIPLNFIGEPMGVKNSGGMLDLVITEVQVNCKPGNIPEAIDVEVSALEVGDALHIHELKLPEGVEVIAEADQVVASILYRGGGQAENGEGETEEVTI